METLANTLRKRLSHSIVRFTFRKIDGEIRHAIGTRNLDAARAKTGEYIPNPKGEQQPNSYYDIDKMGWRSYKPELLISIDEVIPVEYVDLREETPVKKEIPVEEPKQHYNDDPISMTDILKGIFGGVGFGGGMPVGVGKKGELPPRTAKIGTPVATERGVELPSGVVPVEDFAKIIAHYVVEELIERITR